MRLGSTVSVLYALPSLYGVCSGVDVAQHTGAGQARAHSQAGNPPRCAWCASSGSVTRGSGQESERHIGASLLYI